MDTLNTNPTLKKLVVGLLGVLIAFTAIKTISELKSLSYIGKSTVMQNMITVSGKGEVITTPDIATFTFSVEEEAASVGEAQKKASNKIDSILSALKKGNVDAKDIKTIGYNIYPRYEYTGTAYIAGKQVLAAYVVTQSIQVKVRKLEDAGTLLSGIGEYGATNVSGLTFSVDAIDTLTREARDKAIVDAREQAKKLAKALGVTLGNMTSFYENGGGYPSPIYYASKSSEMAVGMGGDRQANVELPSGENKIISNVSITYEIK